MIPKLNPTDIHIWHINFDDVQAVSDMSEGYRTLLSREELARADSIRVAKNKIIYILAKMLVRRVLSGYCETPAKQLRFAESPFGKPYLVDSDSNACAPEFNLSHCGNCIVLAVSNIGVIGVDVERYQLSLERDIEAIAERFYTPLEQSYVARSRCSQQSFLQLWTLKEAWVKCVGKGLSMPLKTIEFRFAPRHKEYEQSECNGAGVHPMRFFHWTDSKENQFALCLDARSDSSILKFFTVDSQWQQNQIDFHYEKVNAFQLT